MHRSIYPGPGGLPGVLSTKGLFADNYGLHLETFIATRADSRVPRNERTEKLMGKSTLFLEDGSNPQPNQTFCHGLS